MFGMESMLAGNYLDQFIEAYKKKLIEKELEEILKK